MLVVIEPLVLDADRFKQRAGAELLAGLLRGSKHWQAAARKKLWDWFMAHIGQIFSQVKPDTVGFWESLFHVRISGNL